MELHIRSGTPNEIDTALVLLKKAASVLQEKKINQWGYWLNPSEEKINWIREGFNNHEFFFVENHHQELMGMFRLLDQDELYWGKQTIQAKYIHSLVVVNKFAGRQLGKTIIERIEKIVINQGFFTLRLDCNASNPILCNYYENLKFIKVGEKQMPHSLNNLYQKELLPKC